MTDFDVIIAGGGPVGLGLAIELSQRDIKVLVIERFHSRLLIPKGQNMTQRTAEHFRAWQVVKEMRAKAPVPREVASTGATGYGTLTGPYTYEWLKRGSVNAYYAEAPVRMPQYCTEWVLRDRAEAIENVTILYDWTVEGHSQSADGVSVDVKETKGEGVRTYKGKYLVGCDGAWSKVREDAGIEQAVDARGRRMILTVVNSPELSKLVDEKFPGMDFFNVLVPELEGYWQFLGRVDMEGDWFFHRPVASDTDADNVDVRALLTGAVGVDFDLEVKYLGFWDLRFAQAKTYRSERVFVAGDAGHAHPPYGGYGVNSGFEDVRNLGWKLAAVLKGWAGETLLDSYQEERHPVFASTRDDFIAKMIDVDAAFTASFNPAQDKAAFEAAWAERSKPQAEVNQFVPNYAGSSLVAGEGRPSALGAHSFAAESGYHLAPATLSDGSCVYDHLGQDFSLVVLNGEAEAVEAIANAANSHGIPLNVLRLTATEETTRWGADCLLVRPDHFVAYAGTSDSEAISNCLMASTGNKVIEYV